MQRFNTTYTYDALSRLTKMSENGVTAAYTYDTNGNRSSVTYNNGLSETYAYNLANLVTSVTNKSGAIVRSSFTYTYLLDGNQRTKTDNTGKTTTYTYDGLGRLKSESESGGGANQTYLYTYDDSGNRIKMTATGTDAFVTSYTYDKNNRLLEESKVIGSGEQITAYTYDPNGNQLGKVHSLLAPSELSETLGLTEGLANAELYTYNGFNQLIETWTENGVTAYAYYANGLRASKTYGGVKTDFVLDGGNVVLELRASILTAKYIRAMNLVSATIGSDLFYYLYNAHGDVVQLANSSGVVTKTYIYDAFGVEKNADGGDVNPYRYCGEYWDEETGTYYLRARSYNPRLGRFTSEDPIRDGLNYYTYCSNNPITFIDPWGLADIALRSTIEGLGGTVVWNKNKTATVYLDGQSVIMYDGDENGSYIDKNGRMHTDDAWLFTALAYTFNLGKGWTGRIEQHGTGNGYQKHVVLTDKYGNEHAQNIDGSPHDKGGSPPNTIKKKLKSQEGWDWDQKDKDWLNKIEISAEPAGYFFITYPNGRTVTVYYSENNYFSSHLITKQRLRDYSYGPIFVDLSGGSTTNPSTPFLPMPNPVPIPVPAPVPMPLPIFP